MTKSTSILLDALRFSAALGVFVSHCLMPFFSVLEPSNSVFVAAHQCVVIFFVLSGYLISHTTIGRGRTWHHYCAARLARLYSVVLPAILLTGILYAVGRELAPAHYAEFTRGHELARLGITALFLNEVWFFSAAPPSNLPFWSLSFEFWFYILFGLLLFVRRPIWRGMAVLTAMAICGPKILLLFPVWLAGAAAFAIGRRISLTRLQAILGLVVLVTVFWLGMWPRIAVWPGGFAQPPLYFAGLFVNDCLMSVFFAAALVFADQLAKDITVPSLIARSLHAGAGITFSLYLFHCPLLIFTSGLFPYDKNDPFAVALAAVCVLLAIVALGYWFERRETLQALSGRIEAWLRNEKFRESRGVVSV